MLMAGVGEEFAFSQRELNDPNRAFVCQGGWGIHSLDGCVHRCAYCPEGYVVNVMLDLEEFADHVGAMLRRRPEQKVFRYDLYSDQPCFEPEYGASEILSDLFARTADQYLLFYTKSDNVDHLLTLPRRDHSIYYCTLATDTAACLFEPGAPGLDRRIEGLRRCQEAGFAVRVGFSPIIPVANWRAEATAMLERLLAKVRPETVRLWVLSLMAAAELEAALDVSALDAEIVAAMRRATMDAVGWWNGPFPRETRAEIYAHYIDEMRRVSPETPVSLCSEERAVWELLAGKLRMSPDRLFCCCGGTSVPIRRP
jgi:spore photoproduct lyase